jgi:hypothetical protein
VPRAAGHVKRGGRSFDPKTPSERGAGSSARCRDRRAIAAWATVVTGTWVVYPWYREKLAGDDLSGCASLEIPSPDKCSPRDFLLSNVSGDTDNWHEFGMEWKEHVAWIAPMLATSAAIIIAVYGRRLADAPRIRQIAIWTFVLAFATAAVAGILGALITKVAPVK